MSADEAYARMLEIEKERYILAMSFDKPIYITTSKDKEIMRKIDVLDMEYESLYDIAFSVE